GGGEVPFGFAFLVAARSALVLLALQFRSALGGAALLVVGVAGALPGVRRLMPAGTLRAGPRPPAASAALGRRRLRVVGGGARLPLFLTVFRGQSATMAGLALSGATLTWTAGAWVQARVARRGARSVLVGTGATLIAGGIVVVGTVFHGDAPLLLAPAGW